MAAIPPAPPNPQGPAFDPWAVTPPTRYDPRCPLPKLDAKQWLSLASTLVRGTATAFKAAAAPLLAFADSLPTEAELKERQYWEDVHRLAEEKARLEGPPDSMGVHHLGNPVLEARQLEAAYEKAVLNHDTQAIPGIIDAFLQLLKGVGKMRGDDGEMERVRQEILMNARELAERTEEIVDVNEIRGEVEPPEPPVAD